MRNLPVHWSEGLFLRPHHFQAADRFWTELIQTSEQWDHPYNYGLRSLTLSKEAIGNYQVEVVACEARMKDGTAISRGAGQEFERVDLKPAFEKDSAVTVYLGIPKLKLGRMNVGRADSPDPTRYAEMVLSLQDESAGGNDQEIGLRDLNVRVLLSTADLSGYEVLPIARIQRAADREVAPKVDADYFPPLINVDAWPELSRGIIREIYDLLGQRLEVIGEQVRNRGITMGSQEPGDVERISFLCVINQAYSTLGCMAFAAGHHPLTIYTELCRIVGALSVFGPQRRVGEIPAYDHDDLARIFKWARKQIELLLFSIQDYEFEQRYFVGSGKAGMQVAIEAKWLNPDWSWFVGVHSANLSPKERQDLLAPPTSSTPQVLDWKMASSSQVDMTFRARAQGVVLEPVTQVPRALKGGGDWLYYQVSRGNAAWNAVVTEQTLAMRFKEELIANMNELQGQRTLWVQSRGKRAMLEFALFAVPKGAQSIMTPEFSKAVDPVFLCVLDLLSRIESNEAQAPENERMRIRRYLENAEARLGLTTEWLLAKYALVAWIDEVLIEAEWQGRDWWLNNVLEVEFYNRREAHSEFYAKAIEAAKLPNKDALEVFYVCVMMEFRGQYRDGSGPALELEHLGMPPDLGTWVSRTALAIRLRLGRPDIAKPSHTEHCADPLEGKFKLLKMLLVCVVLSSFTLIIGWNFFAPKS